MLNLVLFLMPSKEVFDPLPTKRNKPPYFVYCSFVVVLKKTVETVKDLTRRPLAVPVPASETLSATLQHSINKLEPLEEDLLSEYGTFLFLNLKQ